MKYVVNAKKSYLKSPLTTTATSIILRAFQDTDDNDLALASFGDWFVVVIKQGDSLEIIKCSGLSVAGDGTATLTVATNGRSISPVTPFTGGSTGLAFQSGAEVIVTNDPLSMAQFGNLNLANTWALVQTFTLAPKSSAAAVASNELVRKAELDAAVLGVLTVETVVVPGVAGETVAVDQVVYLKAADGRWWLCDADTAATVENVILGITRGAGTAGVDIAGGVTLLGEHTAASAIFSANTAYFCSNTAGGFATSAGTKEVSLGFSRSTTQFYLYPRYNQQITEDQQDALAGTGTPSASNKFVTEDYTGFNVPAGSVFPYAGSSAPTGYLLADGSAVSRTTYAALFAAISTAFGAGDGASTFNLPDLRSRVPVGVGAGTKAISFAAADVNTGTNVITVPSNQDLITGAVVVLTTTTTLPAGLSLATPYYVIRVGATSIKLATTLANAIAGTEIDITDQGTGTHTATITYTNHTLAQTGGEETHALTVLESPAHTHTVGMGGSGGDPGSTSGGQNGATQVPTTSSGGNTAHNILPPYLALNYIIKT